MKNEKLRIYIRKIKKADGKFYFTITSSQTNKAALEIKIIASFSRYSLFSGIGDEDRREMFRNISKNIQEKHILPSVSDIEYELLFDKQPKILVQTPNIRRDENNLESSCKKEVFQVMPINEREIDFFYKIICSINYNWNI